MPWSGSFCLSKLFEKEKSMSAEIVDIRTEDRLFLYFLEHPEEEQHFFFNVFSYYDEHLMNEEPEEGVNGDTHDVHSTAPALLKYCQWCVEQGYVTEAEVQSWKERAESALYDPNIWV